MTRKEFVERTGFAVNAEEYYTIEQLYRVTSMSEEEFCREFKLVNDLIRPGLCLLIQEFGKLLEAVETENDADGQRDVYSRIHRRVCEGLFRGGIGQSV